MNVNGTAFDMPPSVVSVNVVSPAAPAPVLKLCWTSLPPGRISPVAPSPNVTRNAPSRPVPMTNTVSPPRVEPAAGFRMLITGTAR